MLLHLEDSTQVVCSSMKIMGLGFRNEGSCSVHVLGKNALSPICKFIYIEALGHEMVVVAISIVVVAHT